MKTSTRMPFGLIAFLMIVWQVGFGQVTIATIDFETNLSGYSHTPSQVPSADPGDQYFHRAEPSDGNIYESGGDLYTNVTGSWLFVGSNPNTINGGSPGVLTFNAVDVSGFTDIELYADFGAVPNDWDPGDDLRVEYQYDGGSWATLYSFASPATNDPLELTGNATGGTNTANGTVLTFALNTIISNNFSSTGTMLNIRIVCDSDANYEAFGVDQLEIRGVAESIDPEPTNHPTNFIAATGSPATSAIDIVWDDATGVQLPAGYVIMGNTTGTFTDPVDGTDPTQDTDLSDGSALVKVAQGVENYSFAGLNSSTQYFFKIWPYTNSGSNIDFKTDGTPGEDNATTEAECGITALGSASYSCDSNTSGADNDFVTVNISYTGVDAGATLTITSGGGSESNTGDDPTSVSNGTISFAAVEGDDWSVTITGGNCNLSANATVPSNECDPIPTVNDIRINEIDADTPGTDAAEFIELFSPGSGNFALDGLVLVLFNGSNDRSYDAFDLDGFQTDGNGFFIIGSIAGAEINVPGGGSGWLQNGADAVALYYASDTDFPTGTSVTSTNLIDALVYDTNDGDDSGLLSGLGETDQINEGENGDSANESIQRGSWFVASPTPRAVNLPVTLVDFQGKKIGNQALLTWQTSTEQNNSHFLIQRSADGRVFENIGRVEGAGDSDQAINYSFVDDKPLPGLNYYRLHQFDFDGTNEVFGPIAVRFGMDGGKPRVWPVPAADRLQVELPATDMSWDLDIFSADGQLLRQQKVEDKNTQALFDVSALPAGIYFLRWANGQDMGQERFVKQ